MNRPALRGGRRGFTLVELLITLAIIVILTSLTVVAVGPMFDANSITQGGQYLSNQITEARQIAAAQNITVELRLFKMPGAATAGYTGLQLWNPSTSVAVRQSIMMPTSVAISENTTVLSPALAKAPTAVMPADQGGVFAGATYAAFEIRPSGVVTPVMNATQQTNLQQYSLMVLPRRLAASSNTTPPKNYASVQINPLTATSTIYRP